MYRNSYQRGMLTVFFSVGSKPLAIWDIHTQDGYVTRFLDQDIKSMVLEIGGTNVSTTYITCPKGNQVLGIAMPFLVMIVKNLKKYFSFEVTILDETGTRRRFRVSNFQSTTQILPLCTVMPIGLSDGWNQIQFNLAEFTRRAYKKQFVEVHKLKINANIRLRRVYFTERLIPEDELPAEYKLFFPLSSKAAKDKRALETAKQNKENVKPSTSQQQIEQQPPEPSDLERTKSKISAASLKKTPSQTSKKGSKTEVDAEKLKEEQTETGAEEQPKAEDEKEDTAKEQEAAPTEVDETVTAEATETTNVEATETAPAEATETVPAEAAETAPAEATETAPAEATETAPAEATESAPPAE